MKKIKILMLHLDYGGIEKQTITMANALCKNYDVEIVSFYKIASNPAYQINERIEVKYLYNGKPNREEFKKNLKSFHLIKAFKEGLKAIKILYLRYKLIKNEVMKDDADIYFSTRYEFGKILSKYGLNNKITLTQEHNFIDDEKYLKKIAKEYKNLTYVAVISKWHEKTYKEYFTNTKVKIIRIENILDEVPKVKSKLDNNAIIAVGRLNYIKDFNSLIDVVNIVVKDNPKLKLYLLGDGEEKEVLLKKIRNLKLEKNIIMPGFVSADRVQKYMLKSDIYIMTSLRECFPMVLLEAYSCGLPVISFDILSGPHEIVENDKTGYLIANRSKEKMAQKINSLLKDKKTKEVFSQNAIEASKKYTKENIMKKWDQILK